MASDHEKDVDSVSKAEPKASKYADRFKGYLVNPEVKQIYAAMEVCAKAIDRTADIAMFLEKPGIKNVLMKNAPALSAKLGMIANFAKALGPAGVALGVGVDLMAAFGLLEDAMTKTLDEISCQVKELRKDVKIGFESIRKHLKIERTLKRFLDIHDKLQAKVDLYENTVVHEGIADADVFYQLLEDMVKDYPPLNIITDLQQMHLLITGEAEFCDGNPLFEQLAEEVNELEGEQVDQFICTLLAQFQTVICLEIRAIRMLRSFITYQEADVKHSTRMQAAFENLARQRDKHDPFQLFEWYLNFRAIGGVCLMSTRKWPDYYIYMTSITSNVRASKGSHEGDQGIFILTPCNDGTYLISPKKWPHYYMSLSYLNTENPIGVILDDSLNQKNIPVTMVDILTFNTISFNVTGNNVRRDRWVFITKDISKHMFVIKNAQLKPNCYMYMRGDSTGSIRCDTGDQGERGDFILLPQLEPDVNWYLNFKAFGGSFTITTVAYPDRYMHVDDTGKVTGSKTTRQEFTIIPHDGGTFLIRQASFDWYLCMKDSASGEVKGHKRCPGLEGFWCVECNDIKSRTLLLNSAKWPKLHVYMKDDNVASVSSQNGDPGIQGHFIFKLQD